MKVPVPQNLEPAENAGASEAAKSAMPVRQRSILSLEFERVVRSLGEDGALLLRSQIDLRNFTRFAPWLALVEPSRDASAIGVRLVGSSFFELFGRDLTNTDYLDLVDPAIRDGAHASARLMVDHPCGLWQLTSASAPPDRLVLLEYTAFPLFDDRRNVNQILTFAHHEFTQWTGYPAAEVIRTALQWHWIDLGVGVPGSQE